MGDEKDFNFPSNPHHTFQSQYIEYIPGSLNVILSVPHGGILKPKHIPNRDAGRLVDGRPVYDHGSPKPKDQRIPVKTKGDRYTVKLTRLIVKALEREMGKKPHVVINRLHRLKLDCNCDCEEASFRVPVAVEAWKTFHQFIDAAKSSFGGRGVLFDIHGHAHRENWIELGYGINARKLDSEQYSAANSTIRNLSESTRVPVSELISGPRSLGGLLESIAGLGVVPSPSHTGPNKKNYFSGGYNILRHGSKRGGIIDAIQIESPLDLRSLDMLEFYSNMLAKAIANFLRIYYS